MELSRRDALAALAAVGVAGGGALALSATDDDSGDTATSGDERGSGGSTDDTGQGGDSPTDGPITAEDLDALTAVAETVYPSEVEGVESFVTAFVRGRSNAQPDHAAGVAEAVGYLMEWTDAWYDEAFASLDPTDREEALDRMGVREADPDPAGTDAERVRYYVVNELLFALYSSPTGGELVGIENPQGHPGGTESYRRGPNG
ncbi:gluconate 2-dehydrogenase subunit 3 family protein [Halosimplex aquaticum]|uniref:Gluconate 2-dehydrogenase subunit 3 family protein n=1 Tax=Halosimplex aquaticum TaxID=3026162 RepID=A0ABD5XX47_9EURY|nr:gluconate 2-dehydrogenase subunit 3 family protein [Halosimplex aquaticum]